MHINENDKQEIFIIRPINIIVVCNQSYTQLSTPNTIIPMLYQIKNTS